MKKKMCMAGMILVCFMFMGCGHKHEWTEATCTEPKKCSGCGATEGEALGHEWIEATCTEPKTCSRCGATEGEALGHTLTQEANYQQAAVCGICGQTVGEPLQADFEKYNLTEHFVELDKDYDCVVKCSDDNSRTTNANIVFSNYQVFTSGKPEKSGNFTLNTELPEETGYEYKVVDYTIDFTDENAMAYGASVATCTEDYYDIIGHDKSSEDREDGWTQFTVNWNGEDYTECLSMQVNEWVDREDGTYSYSAMVIVRVPIGYDGFVTGVYNGQIEWGENQYIFDLDNTDTLFFRFE